MTLRCSGPGWQHCEELRRRHFPPDRNVVPAHIALFHHLPGEEIAEIEAQAYEMSMAERAFLVRIARVRSLGRGVALVAESAQLLDLHRKLSAAWERWLIPQDRGRLSPHITVQNKVTAEEAKVLKEELEKNFAPFSVEALGIDFWHYRNGPWEHAAFAPFAATI